MIPVSACLCAGSEGAYLEPDQRYKMGRLEALKEVFGPASTATTPAKSDDAHAQIDGTAATGAKSDDPQIDGTAAVSEAGEGLLPRVPCSLGGNWSTSNHKVVNGTPEHIEIFQPEGERNFTIRTTDWGSVLSYGHFVDANHVEIFMVVSHTIVAGILAAFQRMILELEKDDLVDREGR